MFCYGLGDFYFDRNEYSHSIEYYDHSIKIDNNFTAAWHNRGLALHQLARYEEAITSFEQAIRIKPDYIKALYNKGVALHQLARYEEAIRIYDNVTTIDPNYADAWYNIACSNIRKQENEKAISCLEKAIEIGGDMYMKYAKEGPEFDDIRNLERFKKLIKDTDMANSRPALI